MREPRAVPQLMALRIGRVFALRQDYWPRVGATARVDAAGYESTYGEVLAAAPADPTFSVTHAERTPYTGDYTGVLSTAYFDAHGDGTGTSMDLWIVRVRLLDGSLVTATYPDVALDTVTPHQTITISRADA